MNESNTLLDAHFVLRPKAVPLPCAHRPLWRMSVLLLLIERCYGEQATIEQLHVLNWAIRSEETRRAFLDFVNGKHMIGQMNVRRDPSLNRALEYAYAEGLLTVRLTGSGDQGASLGNLRIALDLKGKDLLREIEKNTDCFVTLKLFLAAIGRKITQTDVVRLFARNT